MKETRVVIGGDIFPRDNNVALYAQGDVNALFSGEIIELFDRADFTVCNLEGALTDTDGRIAKCGPSIKAPAEACAAIRRLGVDCVTLANNHAADYGRQGIRDTCQTLAENGIRFFGGGENEESVQPSVVIPLNGKSIAFYAVSETVFNIPEENGGANLYDEYRACREIGELKRRCDYLIVLYHGGVEYYEYPTPWVRRRFHRMADSGADCVLAQHTHCIGTREDYNGAYLLYGQGNFHFDMRARADMTKYGLLLELVFSEEGTRIKPHRISLEGNRATYDPRQDLSGFEERNRRLAAGESFEAEFSAYCEEWFVKWLLEFRGLRLSDKLLRRLLPTKSLIRRLRKKYRDVTVLRMLEHVRGEEDVEVMQQGLRDFFRIQ